MKKLKGYVFSRKFSGNIVPQKIQNIILRDYCFKKNYNFVFSSVEYSMESCFFVLDGLLKNLKKYNGLVAYSIFQLPEDKNKRIDIYQQLISKEKELHFVLEDTIISKKNVNSVDFIEETISIKNTLNKSNINLDILKNYI